MTLLKVIIPQAIRIATPPQTSNCISIVKDTSLASVVAMPDLLKQATDAQALMANPSPLIAAAGDLSDHPLAARPARRLSGAARRLRLGVL